MKMLPAFKDYLWGGETLVTRYNKITDKRPVAESWELSCHPDGESTVENGICAGMPLARVLQAQPALAGEACDAGNFPILIKLIDAAQSLSVQVHPDDAYARRVEGQRGKNEMWYVVDALPGASLIMGTTRPLVPQELRERIQNNTLLEVANTVPVKAGDCFCIPAGLLHAIGAGVLVAEVQQSSNVTYRVYDYNRKDAAGHPRPLHIDRAVDVIDTALQVRNTGESAKAEAHEGFSSVLLTDWKYFNARKLDIHAKASLFCSEQSFHSLLVLSGDFILEAPSSGGMPLTGGDCVFIPADFRDYTLLGAGQILLVSL